MLKVSKALFELVAPSDWPEDFKACVNLDVFPEEFKTFKSMTYKFLYIKKPDPVQLTQLVAY